MCRAVTWSQRWCRSERRQQEAAAWEARPGGEVPWPRQTWPALVRSLCFAAVWKSAPGCGAKPQGPGQAWAGATVRWAPAGAGPEQLPPALPSSTRQRLCPRLRTLAGALLSAPAVACCPLKFTYAAPPDRGARQDPDSDQRQAHREGVAPSSVFSAGEFTGRRRRPQPHRGAVGLRCQRKPPRRRLHPVLSALCTSLGAPAMCSTPQSWRLKDITVTR